MELEGDSPAPRPPTATQPTAAPDLRVEPENVVALAVLFRDCADLLKAELAAMKRPKWLPHPWMEDPVSKWAQRRFEKYFVEGEEALIGVVQAQHDQYADITRVLRETGRRYGLAEELAAAGFAEIGAAE